jgi:hypothetical protein
LDLKRLTFLCESLQLQLVFAFLKSLHDLICICPYLFIFLNGIQKTLFFGAAVVVKIACVKNTRPARPTRLIRPKKSDPNRRIPAGFPYFPYYHGLNILKPDGHGSGDRTG